MTESATQKSRPHDEHRRQRAERRVEEAQRVAFAGLYMRGSVVAGSVALVPKSEGQR